MAGITDLGEAGIQRQLAIMDKIDRGEPLNPRTETDQFSYRDLPPEGKAQVRADLASFKPKESTLTKGAEALELYGKTALPVSPEEEKSRTYRWASGFGGLLPYLVAGTATAPLGGEFAMGTVAAGMGLSGAHGEAEAARAKGATPEQVAQATGQGFVSNAALGMLPLHAVMTPAERLAPGIVDWARARLVHAAQSGLAMTGFGEAQELVSNELIQHQYDPNAAYSPDMERMIAEFIGGAGAGVLTPTPYRGSAAAEAAAARAAVVPPEQPAADIQGMLDTLPGNTEVTINGQTIRSAAAPTAADTSILGGERPVSERQSLQALLDSGAPVDDLAAHPMVQRALEQNRAAQPTGTADDFANPDWRANRVYDFGGEKVQGWDAAVDRLTDKAESYSTDGPVENGQHAVIVLGPPAAGKSAISEPLARSMRAAIIDPDDAKRVIPEYRNGLGTSAVHEESSELSSDLLHNMVAKGANIVLPLVGMNPASIQLRMNLLKQAGYTVDIAHVAATPEISARRNIGRFLKTGRLVDPNFIAEVGDKPRQTAYMLRGEANDFADADTSQHGKYEILEGSGPLADTLRAGRNAGPGAGAGATAGAGNNPEAQGLIGTQVPGISPHRITAADGTAIEAAPVVVEADSLRTSQDPGYDSGLQPRQRDRAASQAQVRNIATNLDPERLGYSAEADRGAPIVGPDGMVESGNGRVLALRSVYGQNGEAAQAYRDWLSRQGVDVSAYRNPVLVRQRLTPMSPEERRDFTVAANQAATLSMSAPERAMADSRMLDANAISLIRNPNDLGAAENRDFVRRFVAGLPQGEQGAMADARGALSAEGLTRVRNAVLAKAYGDASILSRIAESTNDEVKSVSHALVAAAPDWARFRAEVQAGRVRPDMDVTPDLIEAVRRTADLRSRGGKLDTYLAQQDAFDKMPEPVETFMRMFYEPDEVVAKRVAKGGSSARRAAGAKPIAEALRYYAEEASKVSADEGLGLGLMPVYSRDVMRLAAQHEWEDFNGAEAGVSNGGGAGIRTSGQEVGGGAGGPWLGPRGAAAGAGGEGRTGEATVRAQRPEGPWLTEPVDLFGGKGAQYVIPGAERIGQGEQALRGANAPLRPKAPQRPMETGLFGETRPQGDLFAGEETNGRPESGEVRGGTQAVSPGKPARRVAPTPAKRPAQLSLFGGEPSGGDVPVPNAPVQGEQGGAKPPVPQPSESVTKPPAGGGGTRTPRLNTPAAKGIRAAQEKIAERSRSNYRITPEDQIGIGGPKAKVRANLDAIRVLKRIEEENRDATPEEKAQLVKYVGWGSVAQEMFAERRPEWKDERAALQALLTEEEYDSARASTPNAHYTSPEVVRGMWSALDHLGYSGGLAIEPSAGIGHFIGLIPDKVAPKTAWTAVELDSLSARITKALYGGAEVNAHGFEELKRPSNYYDLAISNVPFGDYNVSERPYGSFPIHDFFFVKSLDKVRPGGVVSFITSRYSMDRVDDGTRQLLAKTADLVGAIRLPGGNQGAFAKNAGTQVTTDILFLRKKIPGEAPYPGADWMKLKEIQTPEGPVAINEYFADHPEMMLGEMRLLGSQYRANEPVLIGNTDDIENRIADVAQWMRAGSFVPVDAPPPPPIHGSEIEAGIKDGAFFVKDGKVFQRRAGQGYDATLSAVDSDKVSRLVGMRDIINNLLGAQLRGEPADAYRTDLRKAYDDFVKQHGPINLEERTVTKRLDKSGEPVTIVRRPNLKAFDEDPDAWKVAAIEQYDAESGKTSRSAIQTKDVIDAPRERQINSPSDALSASLDDTGGVDLDHIAQSLNLDTHEAAVNALGDMIFNDPDGRKWQTADRYLSGDVVKKLEDARSIAKDDPSYLRNVTALEKVQPTPLTSSDITAQFGAPWVPADVYHDFMTEVLGARNVTMARVPVTGEWRVKLGSVSADAQSKFGTNRTDVGKIADAALNNRQVTVWDTDHEGNKTVNDAATQEARVKTELMKEAFTGDQETGVPGWVWSDPDRTQKLEGIYNRTYNNLVPRQFDGSHLTLPGLNPDFATRQHRKDAVWRMIQNGNTLLAHVVGSGKTATMIAGGMEMKRLGLINKPAYVIPNHMLEQFSREFIQAYPNSKILVAQKEEMSRENRKSFLAKASSNDWDGIIITHDAFGRINMGRDFRAQFVRDQLNELERVMKAEVEESGKSSPTVKGLEKAKKKLQDKLQNLLNEERKDTGTSFEESGIDHLFVDEAHLFKNLAFITRMSRVKGLAQGDSQRAEDLFLKMRYLEQKRPGRSAVFATGTPVSNTMAELWTMMRYLELGKLHERGLDTFDAWASTFGRITNNMELSADGRTFKEVSSFSKFVNVPELISLYSEIADTKTADMLNLPRPEVKTRSGAPGINIVEAEPSAQEEEHINKLVKLAESLKGKRPEKGQPNMLSVVTEGRKVATDGRLISGDFDFNPQGKIAKAVDNISRIYKDGNKDPAAPDKVQMVFLDLGTPKSDRGPAAEEGVDPAQAGGSRLDLYADLKKRLVAAGIPAREIAAIHDAKDDEAKAKLFSRVRKGDVRVLIGSTGKMGVGTNVQDRLIAMHHLDAPWKPAEVEQRDGRIVRQGNMNPNVQIYRYVTKKSFDAFMWQKLDTKSKFIGQVLSGAKGSRHAEDIDNPLPEAAEMKAAASGDPRVLEHAELDRQVRALTAQRRAFEGTQSRATWELGAAKSRIDQYEKALPDAKADAASVTNTAGDLFSVDLGGVRVTDRKEAGQAILNRLLGMDARTFYTPKVVNVGRMSGFDMNIQVESGWSGDGPVLKASTSLKGKSVYGNTNPVVINEHTDAGGLIRRFENILANIKQNPERLDGQLAGEKDSVKRLEKTLGETWPKEKDYREALKKLSDLTTQLKAPKHPDVAEAEGVVRQQRPEAADNIPNFRTEVLRTAEGIPYRVESFSGDTRIGSMTLDIHQKRLNPEVKTPGAGKYESKPAGTVAGVVNEAFRRSGVATAMYRAAEEALGRKLTPGYELLPEGQKFWENYRPEALGGREIPAATLSFAARRPEGKEGQDFGPKEGEIAKRIGAGTEVHVRLSGKFTEQEKNIAEAVRNIGQRMAPQANVKGAAAIRWEGSPIWGAFINSKDFPNLIAWSLERGEKAPQTVRHEIIHHLKNSGLIHPEEWDALSAAAVKDNWVGKHDIEARYPDLDPKTQLEEAIAEQFAKVWSKNRSAVKPGLIRDAFNRIDLFLRRVAAAARQFLGQNAIANDVFSRIEAGEVGRREMAPQPFDTEAMAQTPEEDARLRRQATRAITPPRTPIERIGAVSDNLRQRAADVAKNFGVDEIVRDMQVRVSPMAARDATVESRAIVKQFMIGRRQARQVWNQVDKSLVDNFSHTERKKMWEAADEESVLLQQQRMGARFLRGGIRATLSWRALSQRTPGIGLDRLDPRQRAVVDVLQRRSQDNFDTAKRLKMIEGEGIPSYVPRMLVRMAEGKSGAGAGSEVVKDIRTLALANSKLEDAIAARQMIDTIETIGKKSGNPTVNAGGAPVRNVGPGVAMVSHVLDQIGKDVTTKPAQLRHRKYLTTAETEAAAQHVPTAAQNAPKWFTLDHPAFKRWEPRMETNPVTGKSQVVRNENGETIFDHKPIYVRSDFEGPLKAALSQSGNKAINALMSLKGKVMSIVMFSPLIHNQVEWGRALPAAPGKVVTGQVYFEGNRIANDPAKMKEAIDGGLVPIGGHGFMQDITSIAEAPTARPGYSLTAKGLGYGAEALGYISRLYNPRSGADEVRRAVDWMGNVWHNTLLWDRVRDLQLGLWSHLRDHLIDKGHDPYAANVAAAHFANRYAGALPVESMSGGARAIANALLFSRTFTLGNVGAYKDALLGLPRDAQALIEHELGPAELARTQSFVKAKSRAMLAIDAALFYTSLSMLQSAFHVAGVGHTVATLGGMIAGGALGGKGGKYGRLAAAGALGAAGYGLASALGASNGTRTLEEELGKYWERFEDLLGHVRENPLEVIGNPFNSIMSLSSTAENEPDKRTRLLIGYDENHTGIYARLAAGKVTEELVGYATELNDMIHRKLSTFARPLVQAFENNIGFRRYAYDPTAETPAEEGKVIAKVAAMIVGDQLPLDVLTGAKNWLRGGPGSDVAGLKAAAPLLGTTVSSGFPGGAELGVMAHAKAKHEYQVQEAIPGIRDMIRQGNVSGAQDAMQELGIPPGLQNYYIKTTENPSARMTKRQMQDFMRYATPEQQREFERVQGGQKRARGGSICDREPEQQSSAVWDAASDPKLMRARGGRVEARNINHNPTDAQKKANNYAHDKIHTRGLRISIENAAGSYRSGIGKDGKEWRVQMKHPYGYILGTEAADHDHVDCYIGKHPKAPHVFIVDQIDTETGKYDEPKCFINFANQAQAVNAYKAGFSDGKGKDRIGAVHGMTVDAFREWLEHGNTKAPYKPVKNRAERVRDILQRHGISA